MLTLCLFALVLADPTTDRNLIVGSTRSLQAPGALAGAVIAHTESAFVLGVSPAGEDGIRLPLAAASRFGQGRAMVLGHEAFWGNPSNSNFFRQALQWLGQGKTRVGLLGVGNNNLTGYTLGPAQVRDLQQVDILVMNQGALDAALSDVPRVQEFVRQGGGLLVMGPAWGWAQLNPSKRLAEDHSGQRILSPMGLGFSEATLEGFQLQEPGLMNHAGSALSTLRDRRQYSPQETNQRAATLESALTALPTSTAFRRDLGRMLAADSSQSAWTTGQPVRRSNTLARLAAIQFDHDWRAQRPRQVKKHSASDQFPGPVPAEAPRDPVTVSIDHTAWRWISTGRYAAPGEFVAVSIPDSWKDQGVRLRIGGHSDTLWHLDSWQRFPSISIEQPFSGTQLELANPFGGMIYLVPARRGLPAGSVQIRNSVAAPVFFLGQTRPEEWPRIRRNPAPWGEIVGRQGAVSVPARVLRTLDSPQDVAAYWDQVVRECEKFFAEPVGQRDERYQVDRQISAGYMHAGYPIMTWEDVSERFVDVAALRGPQGDPLWGFYHEIGHNFQADSWTWDAWGETTNNLFSMFAAEHFNGDRTGAHPAMQQAEVLKRWQAVAAEPGKRAWYAADPWYGLSLLDPIRREFGWTVFTRLFAEFRALPPSERPRSEAEKRTQFAVRLSRIVQRNLVPYLRDWGVNLPESAVSSVTSLQPWYPSGWPGRR